MLKYNWLGTFKGGMQLTFITPPVYNSHKFGQAKSIVTPKLIKQYYTKLGNVIRYFCKRYGSLQLTSVLSPV